MGSITITGLASGIDTDSIIQQLMDIERIPLTRLQTRQSTITAEKSAWQDIYSRLSDLKNKLFDLTLSSTFTSLTAASSDPDILTAQASGDAAVGSYEITVQALAKAEVVQSKTLSEINPQLKDLDDALNLSGNIMINNDSESVIDVRLEDSLVSIRNKINSLKNANVRADIIDNRLVLTSLKTGKTEGAITLGGDTSGQQVLLQLGLIKTDPNNPATVVNNTVVFPENASFIVNGITIERSSNTVTDVIPGVTLNLVGADGNRTVTLTIAYNTQKAKDAIKAFVDQYNSVMSLIAGKMGDKGELQGDLALMDIKQNLWSKVTDRFAAASGGYSCLPQIGISTSDSSSSLLFDSAGKLSISDAKLSEALQDPDKVCALFRTDDGKGLAQVLSGYLDSLLRSGDGLIPAKQDGLDRILKDMADQSQRLEDRLTQVEQRYRQQFLALERALATLQSQGNWLAGQIARMTAQTPSGV
ncbi:MAG: flagellar filament capping protein FliD [Clostridia bacterium]|nr:flagellar filament capping protein FliD [Clostridia bacterium]